jgi:hypothetical protein
MGVLKKNPDAQVKSLTSEEFTRLGREVKKHERFRDAPPTRSQLKKYALQARDALNIGRIKLDSRVPGSDIGDMTKNEALYLRGRALTNFRDKLGLCKRFDDEAELSAFLQKVLLLEKGELEGMSREEAEEAAFEELMQYSKHEDFEFFDKSFLSSVRSCRDLKELLDETLDAPDSPYSMAARPSNKSEESWIEMRNVRTRSIFNVKVLFSGFVEEFMNGQAFRHKVRNDERKLVNTTFMQVRLVRIVSSA